MPSYFPTPAVVNRVPRGVGDVAHGLRMADAAWPLISALALLAMLVLVSADTTAQYNRGQDDVFSLSLLKRF